MTQAEEKEVIRVCGQDYRETDIPTYIRQRDFEDEVKHIEALERVAEEAEPEKEPEKELGPEEIEDERNDFHPLATDEV